MKRPRPLALLALLLAGCGFTTHTVLPGTPPGAGQVAFTFGLQWSPGAVAFPSAQSGLYVGVGDRGVLGGTLTDFLVPSSLSGAVYVPLGDGWLSARAHMQSLFEEQVGPTYEIEGAYAPASGDVTVRGGLGLVAPSPVAMAIRGRTGGPPVRVVVGLGADAALGAALASGEIHVGVTRALARNEVARQRRQVDTLGAALGGVVLGAETVASVEASGDVRFAILTATLRDDRTLTVASRDPYPDCFACGYSLRRAGAYPSAPEARPVWISLSGSRPLAFAHALDVDALQAGWRERGVLDLRLSDDAADRAASGVPVWHDVSVFGGISGTSQ